MNRYIEIKKSSFGQKYRAVFYADNYEPLVKTTERYSNLGDLEMMLEKYFPTWKVSYPAKS